MEWFVITWLAICPALVFNHGTMQSAFTSERIEYESGCRMCINLYEEPWENNRQTLECKNSGLMIAAHPVKVVKYKETCTTVDCGKEICSIVSCVTTSTVVYERK